MLPSLRSIAVAVAAVVAAVVCWIWLAPERTGLRPDTTLPTLLTALAAWVVQVALAWLSALVCLTVLEPWAGRELVCYAGCPAWLRTALLGLCGLAALSALSAPAQAEDHGGTRSTGTPGLTATVRGSPADGLPIPDRPSDQPAGPRESAHASAHASHVVGPGESLWQITAARLPTSATNAAVDHGWRRLYERNRSRIGSDPDRLEPGLRLELPPITEEER